MGHLSTYLNKITTRNYYNVVREVLLIYSHIFVYLVLNNWSTILIYNSHAVLYYELACSVMLLEWRDAFL